MDGIGVEQERMMVFSGRWYSISKGEEAESTSHIP